jgi:mono/diheme cytochrome c family protein
MSIEVKALIAALLVSGITVGGCLGAARIVQSNPSAPSDKSPAQTSAFKGPQIAAGAKLFSLNCARCHGIDATGDEGPDLHKVTKTDERIKSTILHGVKGEMPAFGKKLTEDDAVTLVAFIRSLRSLPRRSGDTQDGHD